MVISGCVGYNDPLKTCQKLPSQKRWRVRVVSCWIRHFWIARFEGMKSRELDSCRLELQQLSWYGELCWNYVYIYIYIHMSIVYTYTPICLYVYIYTRNPKNWPNLYFDGEKIRWTILWKRRGNFTNFQGISLTFRYFTNFQGSGDEITRLTYPPWN